MSIDILQERIRKLKNPSVIDLTLTDSQIPPALLEESLSSVEANKRYVMKLLEAMKDIVPAVRLSLGVYAIHGAAGLCVLDELLSFAKQKGYYVFLDTPAAMTQTQAAICAEGFLGTQSRWCFDSLLFSSFLGSDAISPYAELLEGADKSVFALVRSANKSASEVQDLLTGSRHVYMAAAEIVSRFAKTPYFARNGYSNIGAIAAATALDSLKSLRAKCNQTFLFVDGYDNPGANAKNCAAAFDKLGHGAIVCAGSSITAAWLKENDNGDCAVHLAVDAAERMKRNLTRYISIL